MGSSSSKFKKYLQHGDEYAAMQVYQSSPELRRDLDPNCSYGEHHAHNTALHYASRHGMKHLIRAFLNDLDGDPNRRDERKTSKSLSAFHIYRFYDNLVQRGALGLTQGLFTSFPKSSTG